MLSFTGAKNSTVLLYNCCFLLVVSCWAVDMVIKLISISLLTFVGCVNTVINPNYSHCLSVVMVIKLNSARLHYIAVIKPSSFGPRWALMN